MTTKRVVRELSQRQRIIGSGFNACLAGIPKDKCPFQTGSPARRYWLLGWNRAARLAKPAA